MICRVEFFCGCNAIPERWVNAVKIRDKKKSMIGIAATAQSMVTAAVPQETSASMR